jgi:hypothetical protein
LKRLSRGTKETVPPRELQQIKERLAAIEQIDFFGSAGRDRVITTVQQLEHRVAGARTRATESPKGAPQSEYQSRLWVTRPRPGVDRMASAWLIRKFIDREARFGFVAERDAAPRDAVPFDMFGVEFTHRGELCTFETLCDVFELRDTALASIAGIVHDLDLKDGRFGAPEASAIGLLIEGLRLTYDQDDVLLTEGIALFESFYRGAAEARRLQGPRPVATRRAGRGRARRSRSRRRR